MSVGVVIVLLTVILPAKVVLPELSIFNFWFPPILKETSLGPNAAILLLLSTSINAKTSEFVPLVFNPYVCPVPFVDLYFVKKVVSPSATVLSIASVVALEPILTLPRKEAASGKLL